MHRCGKSILSFIAFALQIICQYNVLAVGEPCSNTVHGVAGTCVNIQYCEPYKYLIQNHGVLASDVLRGALCYYAFSHPVVCCPRRNNENRVWLQEPLYPPVCGFSDATHLRAAVSDGYPADLNAYPWLTALGYQESPGAPLRWLCAGSLISVQHVLTSASCVFGRSDLKLVRLGDHDLYDDNDGTQPIDVSVDSVIIHPDYRRTGDNLINDIALIRLKRRVDFSPAVHPICLPLSEELKNKNYTRHNPFTAGWGSLHSDGVAKHSLLELWYPVLSTSDCQKAMIQGLQSQEIDERVICTGYMSGKANSCMSDKGSPLMYPRGPYFFVIGVLSSSVDCEHDRYPRVYTKVLHYLDFILDNLY